jgi:thiosulfate/3-mercaptopyruvate sulfurtransferase
MIDFLERPLVETDWLAAHIDNPDLKIIDARWRGDGTSSQDLYRAGHIPGAVHLDWELDIAWTDQAGLRYMLLPPDRFGAVMSRAGIENTSRIVVYSDYDYSGSTRLWWALKYYGHEQVAVLNGGWTKWQSENRPVEVENPTPVPGPPFTCKVQPGWRATADEIQHSINRSDSRTRLVDTRPPEQFAGKAVWTPPGSRYLSEEASQIEIGARKPMRAGHIPGAVNITSSTNLDPADWTYLPAPLLRQKALDNGIEPDHRIITYCGVGISASLGLFSLYLAGFRNLALYDASWEEWGTAPGFPVEKDSPAKTIPRLKF